MALRNALAAAAALTACLIVAAPGRADNQALTGTWTIVPARHDTANVTLARYTDTGSWEWSDTLPLAGLSGLAVSQLSAADAPLHFFIRRPSGTFDCTGSSQNGKASGTFVFRPDPSYASALAARGIETPQPWQQFELAMASASPAYVDELIRAGLRPTLQDLLRMHDEGLDRAYVLGIAKSGITDLSIADLFRLRDHGVTPQYISELRGMGFAPGADELVRLVDHGVTTAWVRQVLAIGVRPSVDDLIRMRDAGV